MHYTICNSLGLLSSLNVIIIIIIISVLSHLPNAILWCVFQVWIRTILRRRCCERLTRHPTGPEEMLVVVWWVYWSSLKRPSPRPSYSTTTCPASTCWAAWHGQTPVSWVHSATYGACWTPKLKWWTFSLSDTKQKESEYLWPLARF